MNVTLHGTTYRLRTERDVWLLVAVLSTLQGLAA